MLEAVSHDELERHAWVCYFLVVSVLALCVDKLLSGIDVDPKQLNSRPSEDVFQVPVGSPRVHHRDWKLREGSTGCHELGKQTFRL